MEEMCERCERRDFAVIHERYNKIVLLMDKVAKATGIEEPEWENRLAAIRQWADDKILMSMLPKKRKREVRDDA